MSANSKIEWCDFSWNPVTGCTKISPGCKNCYAETMAKRLQAMGTKAYENGFELQVHSERLEQPKRRKKPTKYFVNSMSDLFHEEVSDEFITQVFDVIRNTPQHVYQILSKRASRMAKYFENQVPPKNAWLGVSVEDRKYGVPRIDELRKIQAEVRFLSIEPLLEDLGEIDLTGIHWVIVGGESGPKARPMKPEWVLNIQAQCEQASVKFFFKQWGRWGADGRKRSKKANGRHLYGKIWDEMPQYFPPTTMIGR
jgi:protein gp37